MKQVVLLLFTLIIFVQSGRDQQIITKDKWVNDLIVLAKDRNTEYSNKYPYNVLYYDGSTWYADCVNLHKSLFNGRNIYDTSFPNYQHDLSNTGDITCYEMIEKCYDVSGDFTKLKEGEPRILYMDEHIGAYLGRSIKLNGATYNVVEATGAFGHKIAFSWVDSDGTRRNQRGGTQRFTWIRHGKPSRWVKY